MYQNPHRAPKIVISIIGLNKAITFIRKFGNRNLAVIAPNANSRNVAITHTSHCISDVIKAKNGAKKAASKIPSERDEGFSQNIAS